MIRPEEIKDADLGPSVRDIAQRATVERQFDDAITNAAATGKWPAEVDRMRDGITSGNVEHVANEYRKVGWYVSTSGALGVRASISRMK